MQMTKGDICKEYREAKRKRQQIEILADLNQVSVDYIKEILKEGGVWQTPGPKPKRKAAIINQDFEDAVNEMIEETNEQQKKDALIEAAHFGLEFMDAKIAEKERFIEEVMAEIEELRGAKRRALKALGENEAT